MPCVQNLKTIYLIIYVLAFFIFSAHPPYLKSFKVKI